MHKKGGGFSRKERWTTLNQDRDDTTTGETPTPPAANVTKVPVWEFARPIMSVIPKIEDNRECNTVIVFIYSSMILYPLQFRV